jgi:peptidyl-prolyl cis-trans isomerase B (cyclophilin B)
MRTHSSMRLTGGLLAIALASVPFLALAQAPPARKPAPKTAAGQATPTPGAGPVVVVETVKGTFEFETYPDDAPKSVEHVLQLVRRNFYNGQRVHRVAPNFVVQFGDLRSRDMTKEADWGKATGGGSGRPIGIAEISKTHLHVRGAVALAHAGDATQADSQIYVTLRATPELNGKHAVIGQVIKGLDVVQKLAVTDRIVKVTVK